jgi:hypothetical protein
MSHTLKQVGGTCIPVTMTIVNYVSGGEAFTLAELGISTVTGFMLGTVGPTLNSLGVALFPLWTGTTTKLFQLSGGTLAEIPTTNALDAVISSVLFV